MIEHDLDIAHSILYVRPKSALAADDFTKLAHRSIRTSRRPAVLRAVLAAAGFRAGVLRLLGAGLEDFLRVFLDIRLPFVAFRRSTIRVLRVSPLTVGFAPAAGQV